MTNPADVLEQLNAAAIALDEAADELRRLIPRYEGYETPAGEFVPGVNLRWTELVDVKLAEIATGYEAKGKRAPAEKTLAAMARAAAKAADADLWAEFHAVESRMHNLQAWMASKAKAISARQSVLRAEGVLAGSPPQWSNRRSAA